MFIPLDQNKAIFIFSYSGSNNYFYNSPDNYREALKLKKIYG